ncbi:MAG: peptidoglycan-binding protein [Clostridia bacterium]|nr:peptidoglycan-binding protein [Clostridia bacterium]
MRVYRIDKKHEAVAEIQTYLRALSYAYAALPAVGIDGIFGTETEDAVRAFQRLFSRAETGFVDADTFALLYREYLSFTV